MIEEILHRLDHWTRRSAPIVFTLFLVLLGAVPTHVPVLTAAAPAWPLVAIFFWTAHRPDVMTPWVVFAIGLFQDVIMAATLGSGIISMLVLLGAVESARKLLTDDSLAIQWIVFAIASAASVVALWLWNTLIGWTWMPIWPALAIFVSGLIFFPPLTWLMTQVQRAFLQRA